MTRDRPEKAVQPNETKIQQGRRQWMGSGHVINCTVTNSRWSLRENREP